MAHNAQAPAVATLSLNMLGEQLPLSHALDGLINKTDLTVVVAAGNMDMDACDCSPSGNDKVESTRPPVHAAITGGHTILRELSFRREAVEAKFLRATSIVKKRHRPSSVANRWGLLERRKMGNFGGDVAHLILSRKAP